MAAIKSLRKTAPSLPQLCWPIQPKCGLCHGARFQASSSRLSSSSTRWKSRQGKDSFAKEAKVQGLKSRAAFKLLEVGKRRELNLLARLANKPID